MVLVLSLISHFVRLWRPESGPLDPGPFGFCPWISGSSVPSYRPFVIDQPLGPNGLLHLDTIENIDFNEKFVKLNLEWQYEWSTVKSDIRSINHTLIEKYSTLRFIFETYNHDGWVLFG